MIALVVNIVILVLGIVAYTKLNTRQYPRSDSAVVNVTTVYFGASADTVRGYITTQLERVISSADGIDYIESTSSAGVSTIKVYLRLNYDTTAALANQFQDRSGAQRTPAFRRDAHDQRRDGRQPVRLRLPQLLLRVARSKPNHRCLNRMVQPRLSSVKGVARRCARWPRLCDAHLAQA